MKPSALFRGVIGRNEIKVRERQTFHSERVNTMARLSSYQLQEWWKEFSQAVYEKANIDVTRVEDLGRVKNYYFAKRDDQEDPLTSLAYFYFPFMARNGSEYVNPPPEGGEVKDYLNWMTQNLSAEINEDKIQELYDMSRAGSLMILPPNDGTTYMMQVYTDESGKLTVSRPAAAYEKMDESSIDYKKKKFDPIPEHEEKPPERPLDPIPEPDPAKYGLTGMPEKPVKPKNMNPGFLSWLGYKLNLNTAYAKKERYEKDSATYQKRWDKWFHGLDREDPKVSNYLYDYSLREQYLQQANAFVDHHLGKLVQYAHGTAAYMAKVHTEDDGQFLIEREIEETKFLRERHMLTPQGHMLREINNVNALLGGEKRTNSVLRNLIGPKTMVYALGDWNSKAVLKPAETVLKQYKVPEIQDSEQKTKEEREAYEGKMKNLGELANLSALSDPSIAGIEPKPGCTPEETAELNFKGILTALVTVGIPHSDGYLKTLEAAREKGMNELQAYHDGDIRPLAESLGRTLRLLNHEVASMTMTSPAHTMNTLSVTKRLLNAMEQYPELKEASGLKQKELDEAKMNMELYDVMRKGAEGKRAILEHSIYKKNLTGEQLQQAGLDVLFAESVLTNIRSEYSKQTREIENTAEHKAIIDELQNGDITPERKAAAGNRMELLNGKRPGFETIRTLSDPSWVEERKTMLRGASKLGELAEMNRDQLGKLISSTAKDIFIGLGAPLNQQQMGRAAVSPALEQSRIQQPDAQPRPEPPKAAGPVIAP